MQITNIFSITLKSTPAYFQYENSTLKKKIKFSKETVLRRLCHTENSIGATQPQYSERIAIEETGSLPRLKSDNKYINLVAMDYYSKWAKACTSKL